MDLAFGTTVSTREFDPYGRLSSLSSPQVKEFSTVHDSLRSALGIMIWDFDFRALEHADQTFAAFFFVLFTCAVIFVLLVSLTADYLIRRPNPWGEYEEKTYFTNNRNTEQYATRTRLDKTERSSRRYGTTTKCIDSSYSAVHAA